jgi:hypothetical protein
MNYRESEITYSIASNNIHLMLLYLRQQKVYVVISSLSYNCLS